MPHIAGLLQDTSPKLVYMDRLEEAVTASRECVGFYRQLVGEKAAEFTPKLAASLHVLNHGLTCLGYREEALTAIREAVNLLRQLAKDQPAISKLAWLLHDMSTSLSSVGQGEPWCDS